MDLGYEIGQFGGNLVISAFSDPKTFNFIVANETSSSDIYRRMLADLVHVNPKTQEAEPALAKDYVVAPDGRSMTMTLRRGLVWSDGEPFDADDVVFTWKAVFDPSVRSPVADALAIEGHPIEIEKVDAFTVKFVFPTTVAVPERLLSGIFILPEHVLGKQLASGDFSSAWGVGMNPAEFVTLGPFKLKEYQPGQKTVLARNDRYYKYDKAGNRLPYLDGITFLSVPDFNSERLKYQNLESHLIKQMRQEDYADLKKLEASKDFTVHDLGPSPAINFLWFNQNEASIATVDEKSYLVFPDGSVKESSRVVDGAEKAKVLKAPKKACVDPVKLAWFRDRQFRKAVSHAINREGIIRSVFYGLGVPLYSAISPGNKIWHNPDVVKHPYDMALAARMLDEGGYRDRDGNGVLEDAKGNEIRFTLITNKGNEAREKMATVIKEDLEKLGMRIDFRPIDFNNLITKISSTYDYEGGVLSLVGDDVDPVESMNVWKSSGFTHQWYPFQPKPSTEYEKKIDDLCSIVQTSQDQEERKRAWFETQAIIAEEQPMSFILSVILPTSARNCVGNYKPAVMEHFSLHNCDMLYFKY